MKIELYQHQFFTRSENTHPKMVSFWDALQQMFHQNGHHILPCFSAKLLHIVHFFEVFVREKGWHLDFGTAKDVASCSEEHRGHHGRKDLSLSDVNILQQQEIRPATSILNITVNKSKQIINSSEPPQHPLQPLTSPTPPQPLPNSPQLPRNAGWP